MKYFEIIFQFILSIFAVFLFYISIPVFKDILKSAKLEIRNLKNKILKNKIDKTKVDDKPNLVEKLIKDIYGEDYVGNNSIGKKVKILVDGIPMEIDNIKITPPSFVDSDFFTVVIKIPALEYIALEYIQYKKKLEFQQENHNVLILILNILF